MGVAGPRALRADGCEVPSPLQTKLAGTTFPMMSARQHARGCRKIAVVTVVPTHERAASTG
jgi:hypothetical protein